MLQRILGASGLTQTELAPRLGVSFVTLNSWVNGRSLPRQKSLQLIEALFAEMIGGTALGSEEFGRLIEQAEATSFQAKTLLKDKALLDRFTVAFTYNTNTIEGSTMTVADTEAVLLRGRTIQGRTLIEQLEVTNHQAALWWLLEQVSQSTFQVTSDLICELHVRLMNGIMSDAGAFRKHAVRIAGSRTTVSNHLKIADQIEGLCSESFESNEGLVADLAEQHTFFEQIHPFADGNGRIGRLLLTALALRQKTVPPIILRERRAIYYKALEIAQTSGDHALLQTFLAESIVTAERDIFSDS